MSDQKPLKSRLKKLMKIESNMICSDCNEKKPTWASLIVPPPGAPPGTETIGAFCCLECSGSHRRLGVHISFVRSVNLDSWKEHEVRAMENGGNAKVNAIFEANLASSGRNKLTNLADGPTRERFIRDKYERRKFFNPAGYSMAGSSGGGAVPQAPRSANASSTRPGAPSEIARQRVANHQARLRTSHSQMESNPAQSAKPKVAQAPVSAPVVLDLLDFGAADPSSTPNPAPAATNDPFAVQPTAAPVATKVNQPPKVEAPPQNREAITQSMPLSAAPTAQQRQVNPNDSIMALFNTPAPSPAFGMQAGMGQMGMNPQMMQQNMNNPQMMQQMGMNPQMNQQQMMMGQMGMNGQMNPQMMAMMNNNMQRQVMLQQQQQQQFAMGNVGNGYAQQRNPQMMQQMGMNPQMNQQQMMMGQMGMNGQMNPQMMVNQQANGMNNFNAMAQNMQQMNVGGTSNNNFGAQKKSGDDGGFGAPMGGSVAQSNDPFSSLGGMNAFR